MEIVLLVIGIAVIAIAVKTGGEARHDSEAAGALFVGVVGAVFIIAAVIVAIIT